MVKFSKLTDSETEEYAKSILGGTQEFEEYRMKKDLQTLYLQTLESSKQHVKRLLNKFDLIALDVRQNNYEKSYDSCRNVAFEIENVGRKMRFLPSMYGDRDNGRRVAATDEKYGIEFYYEGDMVRIKIPELLPKRLKVSATTKEIVASTNYEVLRMKYLAAFQKEMESGNIKGYLDKVSISFIYHFKNLNEMKDYDNLDPKIIIDMISIFMLPDDCPIFHSEHYDYELNDDESSSYTEIVIRPEK